MLLDWLISFGMAFSGQAVITYAAVKMLRTTRPAVIWAIAVVGCMVTGYSNAFAPSADFQAAWSAFNLVLSIVTYIVFSGLRPIKAVLVVACIMLVTLLAEFATVFVMLYGFGVNIASGPAFAHEHLGAYLFLMVFHAIVLGLLFYVAAMLLERFTVGEQSRSLPRTMLFPASQAVMLLVAIVVVRVAAMAFCCAGDCALAKGSAQVRGKAANAERLRSARERERAVREYEKLLEKSTCQMQGLCGEFSEELRELKTQMTGEECDFSEVEAALESLEEGTRTCFCANKTANAVVLLKAKVCADDGISFGFEGVVPEALDIDDLQLCSVFSNLLDNAISAAHEADGESTVEGAAGDGEQCFVRVNCSVQGCI